MEEIIKNNYVEVSQALERAMSKVQDDLTLLLIDYASDYKIRYQRNFTKRIKSFESCREKLKRKGKSDLLDLGDLVGLKVTVNNLADARRLAFLISEKWQNFDVTKDDYISDPKASGYRGIHLNFKRKINVREQTFAVPVEIQIKTLAQDLWSVLSHEDLYKTESEVPEIISQFSNSIGALLDVVDNQAQFIRDFLAKKLDISKDLTFDPDDDVDREIIAKIIYDSFDEDITEEDYLTLITHLETYNITSVDLFRKLVASSPIVEGVRKAFAECSLSYPKPVDVISFGAMLFFPYLQKGEVDTQCLVERLKILFGLSNHECESCGRLLTRDEEDYCYDNVENGDYVCSVCLDDYSKCMKCGAKTHNDGSICDVCWDYVLR